MMRVSLLTILLVSAAPALANPVATTSAPGCGHVAITKYGKVSYCNTASSGKINTNYAMTTSACLAVPDAQQVTITGKMVTYSGSSVAVDGSGTFQFVGGPQVPTIYGTVSFGEQRWPNSGYGPVMRWGAYNFVTARFYPSSGWFGDAGTSPCTTLKAFPVPSGCTSHCSQAQNANTIVGMAKKYGVAGLDKLKMVGIAACESNLLDYVTSPTNNKGLFQYGSATWTSARQAYFGGNMGNAYNAVDNASTAAASIAHSGFGPWDRPANPTPDPYLRYLYGEIRTPPSGCRQALMNAGLGAMAGPN